MKGLSTGARGALSLAAAMMAFVAGGPFGLGAAIACFALTSAAMPLFRRYAMARPNARSSHANPIPQGGGAAVVLATITIAWVAMIDLGYPGLSRLSWIAAASLLLAAVGAVDDVRNLPVLPRLVLQFAAVAAVVLAGLDHGRILAPLPVAAEVCLLVVAGIWFVNLTNFMDGIDGITLAGFLPLAGGAVALSWLGNLTPAGGLMAMAFFGALSGFVWFNLPRAGLFLGDVGSLPVGLLGGALLLDMAQNGALAAAIILPLYHLGDSTITLVGRLMRREKVWEAHRHHAYQRAVDGGWSHGRVSGAVVLLNIALAGLAVIATRLGLVAQMGCILVAAGAVGALILVFRSVRPPS